MRRCGADGAALTAYGVARADELEDIDYRQGTHLRPVRHHLGITAFGTNAWTAENVGDRLMPEHQEDEGNEELYVVLRGRARFEIDGDSVDAPQGTLVFVRPEGNRTAFAEEAGTTVLAIGSRSGRRTRPAGGRSGRRSIPPTRPASTRPSSSAPARTSRRPTMPRRSTTLRAVRRSRG
jgi:mannose-6-phosphate isomerase-like protein (cupin superfamily)